MTKKLRVGILFGGRSGEHEISLRSAASVLYAIDKKKYEVVPVGITKQGRWVLGGEADRLLNGDAPSAGSLVAEAATSKQAAGWKDASLAPATNATALHSPGLHSPGLQFSGLQSPGLQFSGHAEALGVDVVFPVLHGTFGEDGTMQGLLELAGKAYVGSGVLGSAAGMDKDVMKRLFAAAKLPIVKHVTLLRGDWHDSPKKAIGRVEAALKYPLFVKPANLGSSVGISKAHDRSELGPAIDLAASYDRKIVVEQGVGGKGGKKARELEVAVLGNDRPEASVVGEIVPGKEFYDYEAKYESDSSVPIIPAKLTRDQSKRIRQMAIDAFKACDCAGLARVDFLMGPGKSGRLYLNEINTMPGFTSISMYPKLWEASGLRYSELIDRLIQLALESRAEKDETHYSR
ncbi:MAG: D-alanine--D-alanine ligase family protein [Acidobacteriaceae bacterium]